ncbi:MAG: hypothetical protein JWM19_838 [Actinomycetia bacterium]|nr:hypothetical protein [Actinomycetes bacterium]
MTAAAALSAQASLACSVLAERITITPGNVIPGGLDVRGPLATDSYVIVPGTIDGIYDT